MALSVRSAFADLAASTHERVSSRQVISQESRGGKSRGKFRLRYRGKAWRLRDSLMEPAQTWSGEPLCCPSAPQLGRGGHSGGEGAPHSASRALRGSSCLHGITKRLNLPWCRVPNPGASSCAHGLQRGTSSWRAAFLRRGAGIPVAAWQPRIKAASPDTVRSCSRRLTGWRE